MRIGIIGLLHESNTFLTNPTTLEDFEASTLETGQGMIDRFRDGHHEISGFIAGLDSARNSGHDIETVPLFAARALPSGMVTRECWNELMQRIRNAIGEAGPLDGLLVAPHGATVSEEYPDADGDWLSRVRSQVGDRLPIFGTIDAHANLSEQMVAACDVLIAYRTNPHLDQYERGRDAADLLIKTLNGSVHPVMKALFPPLAINIERQLTEDHHWTPIRDLADRQLARTGILSNSIVLGFPYADVNEMGAAVIAIADSNHELAKATAEELGNELWNERSRMVGELISVEDTMQRLPEVPAPVCLLDMGDNVGGGSAGDGTFLLDAIERANVRKAFVCIMDPEAVKQCDTSGIGHRLTIRIGGHTDHQHGPTLTLEVEVLSFHNGSFEESAVRHGGITHFDQGRTAVVRTQNGTTIMLTSRRMVPFSLEQLRSCQLDPASFQCLVAKGVNAPVAAYREVCQTFLRVNTGGSTCADLTSLDFRNRRSPLFPFEDCQWSIPRD